MRKYFTWAAMAHTLDQNCNNYNLNLMQFPWESRS